MIKIWFRLTFSFVPVPPLQAHVLSPSWVAYGAGPGIIAFLPRTCLVFCSSDSYWTMRETEEDAAMFWEVVG